MTQKIRSKISKQVLSSAAYALFLAFSAVVVSAQTTEFTYQGRLTEGGQTTGGNYDFEFKLFDAEAGGTEIGTQQRLNVSVANGIFSVRLDFGANFGGQPRFLEISVRPAGSGSDFTILTPRQPFASAPYSIKSLTTENAANALRLGGVDSNQYVLTTDPRMSDDRDPSPGSANYIQNTTAPQSGSNFNISGNGTLGGTLSANRVNAQTDFSLSGNRVLSIGGTNNLFAGVRSGFSNTSNGADNSFFGNNAGFSNTDGHFNSIFGSRAGFANTTGSSNSFFGGVAGLSNTTGIQNSFFGMAAAGANTTGSQNTFIGADSGGLNTIGAQNSFLGFRAGNNNRTGSFNTIIGATANVNSENLQFATAIGAGAQVFASNTVVLGRANDTVRVPGVLFIETLSRAGVDTLCRNIIRGVSACSSSVRYKTNINPFNSGMALVERLHPITFNWKEGGVKDLGLVAEGVAEVEPLLITRNSEGEIEGVKYDRLTVVLINAVKEQKEMIESLKQIVCRTNPAEKVCQ